LEHLHYVTADVSFTHRQNPVPYPYINAVGHDYTGREPFQLPITLLFLNTVGKNNFPQKYNEWWPLLIDGQPGPLEHPLAGNFDAVVVGGSVRLNAGVTAGVSVEVTFEEHIDDPEQAQELFLVNVADLADLGATADAAASAVNVELPSQFTALTLEDFAKLIKSAILEAQLTALGLINQAKALVDGMIQLVVDQNNNLAYAALDALTTFWAALDDTAQQLGANAARSQNAVVVTNDTSLDAFARDTGMTLEEAIELNPGAANTPGIPRGTVLRYYT
jgi:hypothetical protein